MVSFRVAQGAQALEVSTETLRKDAEKAGIDLEYKSHGSTKARVFYPEDLFEIARWRMNRVENRVVNRAVMSIWNPKGGIGKTTMASNLSVLYALMGLKVLVVDLDFQGSLTLSMGYDSDITPQEAKAYGVPEEKIVKYTLANLLPSPVETALIETRSLDDVVKKPWGDAGPHLVPADLMLDHVDYLLLAVTLQGKQSDLLVSKWIADSRNGKNKLCDLSGYDIIIFDCPPSKNRLTRAALLASDMVVSPVRFDYFSSKSLSYLVHVLEDMQETYGTRPELAIVGNEHDAGRIRSSLHVTSLAQTYGDSLLPQTVRRSEDVPKALDAVERAPISLSKPSSPAAQDFRSVAKMLMERLNIVIPKGAHRG